jgi:hypothetical protein
VLLRRHGALVLWVWRAPGRQEILMDDLESNKAIMVE